MHQSQHFLKMVLDMSCLVSNDSCWRVDFILVVYNCIGFFFLCIVFLKMELDMLKGVCAVPAYPF